MWDTIITIKRTKDLNYFSLCALNVFNTRVSQFELNYGWALFVTYTIIQSIMRSEMCSLHLTHPSVHTRSSGQPTVQRPGSSRGLPVGAGIRTHNLGLPRVSSPTLYPLGQRLPNYWNKWTFPRHSNLLRCTCISDNARYKFGSAEVLPYWWGCSSTDKRLENTDLAHSAAPHMKYLFGTF